MAQCGPGDEHYPNQWWLFYWHICVTRPQWALVAINSLAPGKSECDSKNGIFNLILLIDVYRSSHDNVLQLMPQDLTDDNSTLVQVMAWCRQATSHYLSQWWLSLLSPYGVARPQWVNLFLFYNLMFIISSYVVFCPSVMTVIHPLTTILLLTH